MADFQERLIFRLEVDANNFQRELQTAITAATSNLRIRLQVQARDVRFVGRVDASRLLNLRNIPEEIRKAVESGIGRITLPTRTTAQPGQARGGIGGPRGIDPTVPRNVQQAAQARAAAGVQAVQTVDRAQAAALAQQRIREAAAAQASIGDAARLTQARIQQARTIARAEQAAIQQRRIREAAAAQASLGEALNLSRARARLAEDPRGVIRERFAEQVQRIRFVADRKSISDVSKRVQAVIKRLRVDLPINIRLAGIEALRRALNFSGIRVTAALFQGLGRIASRAFGVIRGAAQGASATITAFGRGIVNLGRGIRAFSRGVRTAISPLTKFLGLIGRSAAVLTGSGLIIGGAAFLPVAAIRGATAAFRELAEFTDGVSQSVSLFSRELSNVSGAERIAFTSEKFRELGATIQDVSARFGLATSDVSRGLFSILSAQVGLDSTAERLEALEASANVAVGGFTDLDSAFKGVIALSRTFGTSFKQASDELFAIQRLGIAPINRLATQLGRVSSLAKSAGADSRDLGAAISTVTAQAVPLETTITGLRGLFGELAKGGSRATRNLLAEINKATDIDLSIDITTLRQGGGLTAFLRQLQQLREIRPGDLERLFPQKRTIAALLPLLDNLNQFEKDRAQIATANNEASAAAEQRLNTLAGAFNQLSTSISNTVVTVADQVASLINLGDRVRSLITTLNSFVDSFRSISSLNLKNFIDSLFSIEGVLAVIDSVVMSLFRLSDAALSIVPTILKAFVGLAEGIKNSLLVAFREVARFAATEFALILTSISKSLAQAIPDAGRIAGLSPVARAQANAAAVAVEGISQAIDGLTKAAARLSGGETLGQAIKKGFDVGTTFDPGPQVERLRQRLEKIREDTSLSIRTRDNGEVGRTLSQLTEGLVRSVDATKIRESIRIFKEEVDREIRDLRDIAPDDSFGARLEESLLDFKASDVARSLVGNIKALSLAGNEQLAELQREASKRIGDLNATLRRFGLRGGLGVPTRQRAGAARALGADIERTRQQVVRLQAELGRLNRTGLDPEAAQRQRGLRLITESDLSDAQGRLNELVARSRTTLQGLALPRLAFIGVGREDLFRGDLVSQFTAVSQEVDKLNAKLAAGGDVDRGTLQNLQELQSSLAIRVLRFQPLIEADPTAQRSLEQSFTTILEGARANVDSIANRIFARLPFGGALEELGLPSFTPISDADRQRTTRTIQQLQTQLKTFAIRSAADLGKDSPIAKAFDDLVKRIKNFVDVVGDIKPAIDKATEGPTGNFDQITFSVIDAEKAVRAFVSALDRSVVDRARGLERALDRALSQPVPQPRNVSEDDARFIGPRQVVDTSVKVFNIQPDDLVLVEDALNQGAQSQQNTARRGTR